MSLSVKVAACVLALCAPIGTAFGGEVRLLPCGEVQFFGSGCPLPVAEATVQELPPTEMPLFPPETLARDTPPLMVYLLDNPTAENAQRYLEWDQQRMARIVEVNALLATQRQAKKGAKR